MSDDFFESSDSLRSGLPLRHVRRVTFDDALELVMGGRLDGLTVAYETYGKLNRARNNAVLICHALSGDSHVAMHDDDDDPGWWDVAVGAGKPIDTEKYFVVCPNILGGCRGTTGPNSNNPATGRPYGQDFPTITIRDMVEVQRRLLVHLGIDKLLAVVGGSMGGHMVLCWATSLPEWVLGAMALGTSARLTSQALAFDVVARNAIIHDPNFHGGQYYDTDRGPNIGLAIARMLGHITYLSREAMREKFENDRHQPRDIATAFEKKFSVGSYLAYQGERFVERFDANSYITLSMAMDLFDLGETKAKLSEALGASTCRWLVVSFTTDWLFPPYQSQELVDSLIASGRPVNYCNVATNCGHDAFLMAQDLDRYGELIHSFLANLHKDSRAKGDAEVDPYGHRPESIFYRRRMDYDLIGELIPPGASVLDLGCGGGSLLARLQRHGHERIMGVELDEKGVLACVGRGLDVVQADLNLGLGQFLDGQFDYVVLSHTLQTVRDVEEVMDEMLRVGRRCIVTFPNVAHAESRRRLWEGGRAPLGPGVERFAWFDTPNIRFLSIADFEDFCRDRNVQIHRRIALDTQANREIYDNPNLSADLAIFVISR